MGCLLPLPVGLAIPNPPISPPPNGDSPTVTRPPGISSRGSPFCAPRPLKPQSRHHRLPLSRSNQETTEAEGPETLVQDLRVPDSWMVHSEALQESEWLRVTLHKWLDDEYCPEAMNVEISKLAARSYYESLVAKQADLGEILLNMVRDLQSLSFQESFHGAFSSANAAVHLIALKMESSRQN